MPSLNPYTLVRWRVTWQGTTPSVVYESSNVISVFVPDGGTVSPDNLVIAQYLLSRNAADLPAATQEIADGLITFIPGQGQKSTVTAPPVPPRILANGPPAAEDDPAAAAILEGLEVQRAQFLGALGEQRAQFLEALAAIRGNPGAK